MGDQPDRRPRLAAILALVAAALAVVIVVAVALEEPVAVLGAIAGTAVGVTGLWLALANRGRARAAGAALAVLGFLGALAFLATAEESLVALALVPVLAVLALLAARRATARRADSLVAADLGRPMPPARTPVLLMNLASGGGKAEQVDLPALCRERGIEPVILQEGDDLAELAERHAKAGADCLGMAGGDGSQAVVAEVAMRHRLPFVVVPAGTRNHLALDLGLDREDVAGALDAFAGGIARTIDLARVNDRIFVNNASLGVYAEIVSSEEYRDAKLRTTLAALPDLLGEHADPSDLEFDVPGGRHVSDAQVLLVANNPYTLDTLDGAGSRARMDTGELGIVSVSLDSADDARRMLALAPIGQLSRFPGWIQWTARTFEVDSDSGEELPVALDGEAMTMAPPLRFESLPRALVVLIPPQAPGRSPAARSVSWRSAREVWQVALGRR